jgi:hypothetical protein
MYHEKIERGEEMKTALLVSAILFFVAGNSFAVNPVSDRAALVEAEREYVAARQAEANGQLDGARHAYNNAFQYACRSSQDDNFRRSIRIGGESIGDLARRALALQKQFVEKEVAANSRGAKAMTSELHRMYKVMEALEPDNPTWVYLDAVMVINTKNYIKGTGLLRRCSNMPGGSNEVKNKARALMEHIKPAYTQQRAWFDEDMARANAAMKEAAKRPINPDLFITPSSVGPSENWGELSPQSTPTASWERQAQNAESHGDYNAADRFRSGSASMSDGQKYWGN